MQRAEEQNKEYTCTRREIAGAANFRFSPVHRAGDFNAPRGLKLRPSCPLDRGAIFGTLIIAARLPSICVINYLRFRHCCVFRINLTRAAPMTKIFRERALGVVVRVRKFRVDLSLPGAHTAKVISGASKGIIGLKGPCSIVLMNICAAFLLLFLLLLLSGE